MSIKISGIDQFRKNMRVLTNKVGPSTYRRAMIRSLIIVEGESMRRTPVDTGKLRASAAGNATVLKYNAEGAKGVVFYTANYAIFVHERTELRHINGEAKFLQNAIVSVIKPLREDIARVFKVNLFGYKGFRTKL